MDEMWMMQSKSQHVVVWMPTRAGCVPFMPKFVLPKAKDGELGFFVEVLLASRLVDHKWL
jgi:hypothetical protein